MAVQVVFKVRGPAKEFLRIYRSRKAASLFVETCIDEDMKIAKAEFREGGEHASLTAFYEDKRRRGELPYYICERHLIYR